LDRRNCRVDDLIRKYTDVGIAAQDTTAYLCGILIWLRTAEAFCKEPDGKRLYVRRNLFHT